MIQYIYEEYRQMVQDPLVLIFFTCIIADFITGLASAWYQKEIDSRVGIRGTLRHLMIVIVLLLFYPYLGIFDLTALAYPFILTFIAQYGVSIIENLAEMDVEVPSDLAKHLRRLKVQDERDGDE